MRFDRRKAGSNKEIATWSIPNIETRRHHLYPISEGMWGAGGEVEKGAQDQRHHYHAGMDQMIEEKRRGNGNWKNKGSGRNNRVWYGIDKQMWDSSYTITFRKVWKATIKKLSSRTRRGKSGCYLYYGYQDTRLTQNSFIIVVAVGRKAETTNDAFQNDTVLWKSSDCRRVQILDYFDEPFTQEECNLGAIIVSRRSYETIDFTPKHKLRWGLSSKSRTVKLHCSMCRPPTRAK